MELPYLPPPTILPYFDSSWIVPAKLLVNNTIHICVCIAVSMLHPSSMNQNGLRRERHSFAHRHYFSGVFDRVFAAVILSHGKPLYQCSLFPVDCLLPAPLPADLGRQERHLS